MSGPGVPSCLLLLAALSSAGVTDGATKGGVTKTGLKLDTKETVAVTTNKDLAQQESKKVRSPAPSKRHIRKFDFDAEFATYLGLASQADTARYLAGEADSSYRAPAAFQESPDGELYPPLRLVPGSTPASFAYFTQIYPNDQSDGDIRIEHFSPVIHPTSSEREKARLRDESDGPEHYDRPKSNYYPTDEALYAPPTSRSYFGRYSNKQRYSESSDDGDKYGPKSSRLQSSKPSSPSKVFDDDSTPDYKMGYRHLGMYHKFHEEDLFPKKTSSEWIPLKKSSKLKSKHKSEADQDTKYDPESYRDAHVSAEDFHVKSENDDEVTRIINNINNDPPYSTNNFDLAEKKVPSVGKFTTKGTAFKGGDGHSSIDALADSPYEPEQRPQKHKRRRKKKKHHRHHHRRPGYRSSPAEEANAFSNQGRGSGYKAPSFEFRNPVNTYVNPPYTPPETHKSNLKTEPYKDHDFDAPTKEDFKSSSRPSAPSEPFRTSSGSDLPLTGEPDKDVSFEEPPEVPEEPADIDYGPVKLDDLDEDYHTIGGTGPTEHTKDFEKRLPEDGKLYGSFETFDSQLDPEGNKKFDPFVQFPFDEQRKKLASVVEELIETGKSRRKK